MPLKHFFKSVTLLMLTVVAPAIGQQTTAPTDAEPVSDKADKTGTNPLNFQRTFAVTNEYNAIDGDAGVNYTKLRYTEALAKNFSMRLEVPIVYAHAAFAGNGSTGAGDGGIASAPDNLGPDSRSFSEFGLGDVVLKFNYIPYATREGGLSLAAELGTPTATVKPLGTEKWTIAPIVTYAFFLPNSMIFAPAYKHSFSFAGDDDRGDVNQGTLDFYFVKKFDKNRQWITIDPTYFLNFEADKFSGGTLRVTYGRLLGKIGRAGLSGFIKPGVGIGNDRPNDWSVEVGVSVIGF